MKRKIKKFAEGGTNVRTRTDEEFAEDSKFGGYGRYMPKTKNITLGGKSSAEEDRPKSSGVEDYASLGKRAGAVSPFSGPKEYISESIKEDVEVPSKTSSETSDEESVAGKGARNLALEEPEIKEKKKTVVKKKSPSYEDTGAKIGSQGDFKMKPSMPVSTSGMGPKNTFLTKERSDAAQKSMGKGFSMGLFERGDLGIGNKKKEEEKPANIGNQSFVTPK